MSSNGPTVPKCKKSKTFKLTLFRVGRQKIQVKFLKLGAPTLQDISFLNFMTFSVSAFGLISKLFYKFPLIKCNMLFAPFENCFEEGHLL